MNDLAGLAFASGAFVATHFLLSHPFRNGLVRRLGERGFTGLYSLVAFVTLGMMIYFWRMADGNQTAWIAPLWWWPVASAIMLVALILLVGSFIRNPAFPHPGAQSSPVRAATGVFAITRHPMNWSFILWAAVHLSLWGSVRNLIVASAILILALFGSIAQDRKKSGLLGDAWREWETRTSFLPFGALMSGKILWRAAWPGWVPILVGTLLWLAITWYHAPIASPIGAWGHGIG